MNKSLVCITTSFTIMVVAGLSATSTATAGPGSGTSITAPTHTGAGQPETVEGVIRLLAADTVGQPPADSATHDHSGSSGSDHEFTGASEDHYRQILVVGDTTYFLDGEQGEPNTRVRVTGTRNGTHFEAEDIDELGPATAGTVPSTGTTNLLVLLAHWKVPDSVTPQQAAGQLFSDTNGWYQDASYAALGQTGDVTAWMKIAGPKDGKCYADHMSTMNQAKAAAAALGYDIASYDNFILYSPNNSWQSGSDCNGYAGWAYVGAQNTWLNGYLDRRVTVHEQGHNYGLLHSHSYLCDEVITGTCSWSDYGDDFDAMGSSGFVGHFSASQKTLLGWMGGRTVDLTGGGEVTLAPMASDALAMTGALVTASSSRSYWLEYRQAIDYDGGLPGSATNGVLLHVKDAAISGDNGSNVLDVRPGDGLNVHTSTMLPGSSWTTPEGFTLSVGEVTPDGASVSVSESIAPTVTSRRPRPGSTGVKVAANVTAKFSEEVVGVSDATFTLTNKATGATVAAVVSRVGTGNKWILDPATKLDRRTSYTAALTGGTDAIRDLSGNPLATTSWSFKTGR